MSGESIVEPEEWARYIKLDGRLKEERRLLKIIARQTAGGNVPSLTQTRTHAHTRLKIFT